MFDMVRVGCSISWWGVRVQGPWSAQVCLDRLSQDNEIGCMSPWRRKENVTDWLVNRDVFSLVTSIRVSILWSTMLTEARPNITYYLAMQTADNRACINAPNPLVSRTRISYPYDTWILPRLGFSRTNKAHTRLVEIARSGVREWVYVCERQASPPLFTWWNFSISERPFRQKTMAPTSRSLLTLGRIPTCAKESVALFHPHSHSNQSTGHPDRPASRCGFLPLWTHLWVHEYMTALMERC